MVAVAWSGSITITGKYWQKQKLYLHQAWKCTRDTKLFFGEKYSYEVAFSQICCTHNDQPIHHVQVKPLWNIGNFSPLRPAFQEIAPLFWEIFFGASTHQPRLPKIREDCWLFPFEKRHNKIKWLMKKTSVQQHSTSTKWNFSPPVFAAEFFC